MIESDVSAYINAAYALTVLSLSGLALAVFLRARRWAKEAKALEQRK
jgi:heme exporter protein CcmD